MNYCDIFVLGIIILFGIIGLAKGFIVTIFRLVSFFVSVVISVKLYPMIAEILMKTKVYTNISASIFKALMLQKEKLLPEVLQGQQAPAQTVIENLRLPEFLKESISGKIPDPAGMFDFSKIMEVISGELAKIVIGVMSFILLYVIIRIALLFIEFILKGIAKLPVFKQMDKLGGFAFGAVEGLLTIYLISAVLMLLNAAPQLAGVFEQLESSTVARFFYDNNFLVNWLLPS